jgi:hypothetical protein
MYVVPVGHVHPEALAWALREENNMMIILAFTQESIVTTEGAN